MAAIYYRLNEATKLPLWLLRSNPLLGWSTNNDEVDIDKFEMYTIEFLNGKPSIQAQIWLRHLGEWLLTRNRLHFDSPDGMVIRRCWTTVKVTPVIEKGAVARNVRLNVSMTVSCGRTIHHLNADLSEPKPSDFLRYQDVLSPEELARMIGRSALIWDLWRKIEGMSTPNKPNSALCRLQKKLDYTAAGALIFQREVNF